MGRNPRLGGNDLPKQNRVGEYEEWSEQTAVHNLMPHSRRPYGFPVSRDWEDIDCKAVGCQFNRGEKCMTPSRCKIGMKGECTGFVPRPYEISKKEGD
jgi:hypothetical protein